MPKILAIESSSSLCSLALLAEDGSITVREESGQRSHTGCMLPFAQSLLSDAGYVVADLDAIAFSAGPGSFTGVRLAVSTAKALAYAANIPVIAVSSLAVLAQSYYSAAEQKPQRALMMMDARMGEVYRGEYQYNSAGLAQIVSPDSLEKIEQLHCADYTVVVGDCAELLQEHQVFTAVRFAPCMAHAHALLLLAQDQWQQGHTQTALAAEAIYLRGKSGWKTTAQQQAAKQ